MYRQINRNCPWRQTPSLNGEAEGGCPHLNFIIVQPQKSQWGLLLESINIQLPKWGRYLEFINIQPPKRGSTFIIHQHTAPQKGSASRIHQSKGVRFYISSTKRGRLQISSTKNFTNQKGGSPLGTISMDLRISSFYRITLQQSRIRWLRLQT